MCERTCMKLIHLVHFLQRRTLLNRTASRSKHKRRRYPMFCVSAWESPKHKPSTVLNEKPVAVEEVNNFRHPVVPQDLLLTQNSMPLDTILLHGLTTQPNQLPSHLEQTSSQELNISSPSQNTTHPPTTRQLTVRTFYFRVHKTPTLVRLLIQLKPVHVNVSNFLHACFNNATPCSFNKTGKLWIT
jgi:hypothetical protein